MDDRLTTLERSEEAGVVVLGGELTAETVALLGNLLKPGSQPAIDLAAISAIDEVGVAALVRLKTLRPSIELRNSSPEVVRQLSQRGLLDFLLR